MEIEQINTLKKEILSKIIEKAKEGDFDISEELIEKLKIVAEKIDINELKDKIDKKLPEIKEESKKVVDDVYEFGKKHPFISLIGAFGIGYLIGKIKK